MNLKDYCFYYDRIIPDRICDEIVNHCRQIPNEVGTVGTFNKSGKKDLGIRDSYVSFHGEQNWIFNLINPIVKDTLEKAKWGFQIDYPETFQFTTYGHNQHYRWHVDQHHQPYKEGDSYLINKVRKVSVSINLSNSFEYEGGDLYFDFRNKPNNTAAVETYPELRNKGSVIVFPSFVWHTVNPVTNGTRYSGVIWYLGENFK